MPADGEPGPGAATPFLSAVLDAIDEGVLVFDLDGRIRYYNEQFTRIWQLPDEVLESGEDEVAIEYARQQMVDPEGFVEAVRAIYESPETERTDHFRLTDGRIIERQNQPWYGEDGEVGGVVLTFRDVTDQRETEEELRTAERRYRGLLEENVAGVYRSSWEGEILECNDALAEFLGYDSADRLRGRSAVSLYPSPEARERFLERLASEGAVRNLEQTLQRADGTALHVLENARLVAGEGSDGREIVGALIDISERKELEEQLREMAYHDPLTGLANRRLLEVEGERELERADRNDRPAALLFIDLVRFKRVNDSFGHQVGDQVLAAVGQRIAACSRGSDVSARVGGDEFALLLTGLHAPEEARRGAERVAACFDEPFRADDRTLYLRAKIGIAVYPEHASNFAELLSSADQAMYRAEQQSGDPIAMYRAGPEEEIARDQIDREEALRERLEAEGLEAEGLELHYQPLFRLRDGAMVGAEALVRWPTPDGEPLRAAAFVPLAERTGLIRKVDRWVVREATRQLGRWAGEGEGPGWVSVNLSAAALADPGLPELMEQLLHEEGLDGRDLVIEVTERMAMRESKVAADALRALRDLDVRVAIDDFGTGYSSLQYLRELDADVLKIDRTFVADLEVDARDTAVVEAILLVARRMGLEVVAEGIESEGQLQRLRDMGCPYGQGFHLARPMSPDRFGELVERGRVG